MHAHVTLTVEGIEHEEENNRLRKSKNVKIERRIPGLKLEKNAGKEKQECKLCHLQYCDVLFPPKISAK